MQNTAVFYSHFDLFIFENKVGRRGEGGGGERNCSLPSAWLLWNVLHTTAYLWTCLHQAKRLESQIYSLEIIDLNWIDKIEYGRVYEIAYGFGGPSENNVSPH